MAVKKNTIVAFCCENSSLQAAEEADPNVLEGVNIVPLPCAGKMEIIHILTALENGYDAVLVLGCPVDNCQYIRGNKRARKRTDMVKETLKSAGIDENLVRMDFLSSVDTYKFTTIVEEMKEYVTNTGY